MDKAYHTIYLQVYNRRLEVQHVPLILLSDGLSSACIVCSGKYKDVTPEELRQEEVRRQALRKENSDPGPPPSVPICLSGCGHHLCLKCALEHFHHLMEDDMDEKDPTVLSCPLCRTAVEQKHKWKAVLHSGGSRGLVVRR